MRRKEHWIYGRFYNSKKCKKNHAPHACAECAERKAGYNTAQKEKKLMANAIKRAARSMRSHRDNKNFRQFVWNAHQRAEERKKIEIGRMLAEKLREGKEDAKED